MITNNPRMHKTHIDRVTISRILSHKSRFVERRLRVGDDVRIRAAAVPWNAIVLSAKNNKKEYDEKNLAGERGLQDGRKEGRMGEIGGAHEE